MGMGALGTQGLRAWECSPRSLSPGAQFCLSGRAVCAKGEEREVQWQSAGHKSSTDGMQGNTPGDCAQWGRALGALLLSV